MICLNVADFRQAILQYYCLSNLHWHNSSSVSVPLDIMWWVVYEIPLKKWHLFWHWSIFSLWSALWGALSEKNNKFITSGKPVSLAREHWQFSPVAVPSSFWLVKSNVSVSYCNVVCFMHWIFSVLSRHSAITKMYWKSALKTGWFSLHSDFSKASNLIYSFNCSETFDVLILYHQSSHYLCWFLLILYSYAWSYQ